MSNYTDLIARLNKKTGPINLSEIVELLEEQTLPADALGPGSFAITLVVLLSQEWLPVSSNRALLITDIRLRAVAGCSLLTMPAAGTFGNWYQVTILNDSGGQLTISGDDDSVIIEDGDIATVIEVGGKQRITFGPTSVIGL